MSLADLIIRRRIVSYNNSSSDDAWAMVCFSIEKKIHFTLLICLYSQVLEEGEDIQELSERAKDKKEQHIQNKFLKENDASGQGTSTSEADSTPEGDDEGKGKGHTYTLKILHFISYYFDVYFSMMSIIMNCI